jgi:hypothetical protein
MAKLNSEKDKLDHIKQYSRGATPTEVRKEIGRVWGIKKTARNDLYRKLFSESPANIKLVKDRTLNPKESDSFNIKLVDKKTGKVVSDLNWHPVTLGAKKVASPQVNIKGDKATVEVKGASNIRTVEELLAYANIDLTEWAVVKQSVNVWDSKYQVKAELARKKDEKNFKSLLETFTKQANERAPQSFSIKPVISSGDDLYVISIQDLHIGKLAHGVQTLWGDYDIAIAKKYYKDAAEQLISNAPTGKIGKVLLIVGSDLIHYENQRIETSSGTKIEGDSRWHKVFDESCQLIAETVESLATQFPVEVMVVAGNHANLSEYALGAYIKAFFRNHPNVNVNNEPANRKYFGHGKTLVGFAHGNGVKKLEELGAVMVRERMDVISNYKHLYWLTGHKHQFTQMMDSRGIRIFVSAALCNPDQWHAENSYVGNIQGAEGYLFSAEDGLTQIVFSKPVNIK